MVKRTANSLTSQLVRPDSGSAILLDGTILNQGDLDSTGGEGGIRTPGRGFSPYNGLANRRIQPLCHLSAVTFNILPQIQNCRGDQLLTSRLKSAKDRGRLHSPLHRSLVG